MVYNIQIITFLNHISKFKHYFFFLEVSLGSKKLDFKTLNTQKKKKISLNTCNTHMKPLVKIYTFQMKTKTYVQFLMMKRKSDTSSTVFSQQILDSKLLLTGK